MAQSTTISRKFVLAARPRGEPDAGTLRLETEDIATPLIYPLTPAELDNQPTTVTATLTDTAGASATGSVDTVIVDPLVE